METNMTTHKEQYIVFTIWKLLMVFVAGTQWRSLQDNEVECILIFYNNNDPFCPLHF